METKIKASIIGVSGYTGLELLRLLLAHPQVEIAHLTSRQHENAPIGEIAAHLSHMDLRVTNMPHGKTAEDSDVVFLCLPHKAAMEAVPTLIGKTKIIDLSADFRLDDPEIYKRYYGLDHLCPELLEEFVYGFPEANGETIKNADNIANPGCFALLAQLLLYPFRGQIEKADIIAVTGSSGLGKSLAEAGHHPIRNHNMKSYQVNLHRHIPEITRTAGISGESLNFVPTSGPFTRGIFATAFVRLKATIDARNAYESCPFIRLRETPALADIIGSNYADLGFRPGQDGNIVIAQGALDNLVKGASGCAVQNMNLMFNLNEEEGLCNLAPVYP